MSIPIPIPIPIPFSLNSGNILYHSNVDSEFTPQKNKFLWTSYDRQQSFLHIFNNCGRYSEYQGSQWPYCYKMTLQRNVNLLPVFIVDGKHYIITNSDIKLNRLESLTHIKHSKNFTKSISRLDFYIKGNNEFGINFLDIINSKKTTIAMECEPDNFTQNCNTKILLFLIELNKYLTDPYDGYICSDDQKEIAFLNPIDVFHVKNIKQFKLINVFNSNSDENITINYCYSTMDFENYKALFNDLFNEDKLEITLSGDPVYDLVQFKNKLLIDNSSIDDILLDDEVELTPDDMTFLISNFDMKCHTINTDNIYLYVHEHIDNPKYALSQIFKYHLCPKIIVNYNDDYKMELVDSLDLLWDFDDY